jgi:hypothetical protein
MQRHNKPAAALVMHDASYTSRTSVNAWRDDVASRAAQPCNSLDAHLHPTRIMATLPYVFHTLYEAHHQRLAISQLPG